MHSVNVFLSALSLHLLMWFTGAVGHHGDNLVEKIISVLPQLPGHTNDVMVNMAELTAVQAMEENHSVIAPGCLAQSK